MKESKGIFEKVLNRIGYMKSVSGTGRFHEDDVL